MVRIFCMAFFHMFCQRVGTRRKVILKFVVLFFYWFVLFVWRAFCSKSLESIGQQIQIYMCGICNVQCFVLSRAVWGIAVQPSFVTFVAVWLGASPFLENLKPDLRGGGELCADRCV